MDRVRSIVVSGLMICMATTVAADIVFTDVSEEAGFTHVGNSYGSSWGDVNGDHWPDLWAGNHGQPVSLYVNQGDGTFTDMASSLLTMFTADRHGAAWADVDNDGDQDLLVTVGGYSSDIGANEFYINHNGVLVNEAQARGLQYPYGRGRGAQWLDWNNDGALDVVIANLKRGTIAPSALFTNQDGIFSINPTGIPQGLSMNNSYAQLVPMDIENRPLLLLQDPFPFPKALYRYSQIPLDNVEADVGLPNVNFGMDSMVADFNGDGLTDVYVARQARTPVVFQGSDNSFAAWLIQSSEIGVEFRTTGAVTFSFGPGYVLPVDNIFIGAAGYQPESQTFTLDSTKPEDQGMPSFTAGLDSGMYIWFDTSTGLWHVLSSNGYNTNVLVTANQQISDLVPVNFVSTYGEKTDHLFIDTGAGFVDVAATAGLNTPTPCENGVAADFDNDMDIDIYLVCQNMAQNVPNILYENQGDGTFEAVAGAGGAAGSDIGRADTVTVADYDRDGLLDLFVNNGIGGPPLDVGPDQLFRNESGGGNRWLQVDLEGVVSNRDGIGARVYVDSGGKRQLRLAGGNMHRFSQNHGRLHFGLGQNNVVDLVTVEWPGGAVQTVADVNVNQLVRVVEPSTEFSQGIPGADLQTKAGVYVWQENGGYTMMLTALDDEIEYEITILSDKALPPVFAQRYQSATIVEESDNSFTVVDSLLNSSEVIRFRTGPDARTLIAVRANGRNALPMLKYGGKVARLTPAGWVAPVSQLPVISNVYALNQGGMYVGTGAEPNELLVRWSGNDQTRRGKIELLSASEPGVVTPVLLGPGDSLATGDYHVALSVDVASSWKGIDANVGTASRVGLTFSQDDAFSWHYVNPNTQNLGQPNAAWLPVANPPANIRLKASGQRSVVHQAGQPVSNPALTGVKPRGDSNDSPPAYR